MGSPSEVWDALFAALERLKGQWPAPDWMYDRRLKCVASSIPLARQDDARAAMAEVLPTSFSVDTLAALPKRSTSGLKLCGRWRRLGSAS